MRDDAIETPGSVLVVDDDPAICSAVTKLLVQAGMEVRSASAGKEALELLELHPFDVVITDLKMPGMDGMELLERVRSAWPGIPVIVLTAHDSLANNAACLKRGAADFVHKDLRRPELLSATNKALAQARHAERIAPAAGAAPTPIKLT